ncbi:hypothetical protein MPDQ_004090 [Monascus purpureus]|uniref:Pentatricopeptide repeat protein n=1 Tax=Monascus purpureus TaxID=5098 RepID=A0A507R2A1_MONPU|nr:hypothetical protein MPDQ_004090 [Monascus purpureus]BDD57888.1 hypothetical protein MAP00_003213 [Monascus purpureus]
MLRQAIRGARWYQHVAHRSPPASSFPSRRAFSIVIPRSVDYGGPHGGKVCFYEQNTIGSSKRRRVDPEAEDREEQKEIEDELSRLDRELEVLQEGPYGPNSPFMKSLSEEERAIALEALRKYDTEKGKDGNIAGLKNIFDKELDEMLREEFEGMAEEEENWMSKTQKKEAPRRPAPFEVILQDQAAHSYVNRFNKCLKRFANDRSNELLRQLLWKLYRRCKLASPNFLQSVPDDAAALLWESQVEGESTRPVRPAHLQTLIADARATGRTIPTPHILSYIESLHDGGETSKALDEWEACQSRFSEGEEGLEVYWKLGVQLFAADDNPQRAQDIALAFLANDRSRQPHILIPVITAWGRQPGREAETKAWALYLQLKTMLGSNMTMDDYDRVSIGLLKAHRSNLALAVFKDMMVTGSDPADDSTALYKAALGLAGNLHASSISENEVNRVSLSALTILPRRFQNRFFYASWMKKLIGMGEIDSAAMVIELMYERGVKPDAKHLNGIIAAWIRDGSTTSRDKAEHLGWAMINQRIDAVATRDSPSKSADSINISSEDTEAYPTRIPKFMKRTVPPATIETFSILLLYYTRRGDDDMVKHLTESLGDARIKPNSYFMNHLLYAELRKHDIHTLWHKYKFMSASIKPDLETYACLWDCGKLQYDVGRTAFDEDFPSARDLYSEMMQWYSQLPLRDKSRVQEEFSKGLYDQIIRCFCLLKDLPGTLVALRSMSTTFGFYPDDITARILVLQVARLAGVPAGTPKRRLRRLSTTPRSKENIAQVQKLVGILSQRKAAALQAQGLSIEDLDPRERQEYQLEIMSDLLQIVIERVADDPNHVGEEIAAAASEMGVSEINLGSAPEHWL